VKFIQALETASVVARNALLGGNLKSLGLIGQPRRMVLYLAESLFLYKAISHTRGLPQKNVFEVLGSADVEPVTLGSLQNKDEVWFWSVPSFSVDIISLSLICRILKPKLVFEIGTLHGYTSFHFGLNTPDDAKVLTLDLPKEGTAVSSLKTTAVDIEHIDTYTAGQWFCFDNSPVAKKITRLQGDSATYDFSPYHGKVDFFFIDGAHSYDYVRSDTLNALKCCHSGSVIAWHDFGRVGVNGVSRWLVELSKKYPVYSVPGGSIAFMVVP
jgi:hypothetical protein